MIIGINKKQELEIVDLKSKEFRPLAILGNKRQDFLFKLFNLGDNKDTVFKKHLFKIKINNVDVILSFYMKYEERYDYEYIINTLNIKTACPIIHIFIKIDSELSFQEQMNLFSKVKGDKNLGCIFFPNNPYLISDCRKEDVYIFNGKNNFTKPDFQTFGASFTLIQMKLFDYKNTIAKRPLNMIKKDFNKKDRESLFSTEYGDSLEKSMFMVKLGNKK